MLNIGNKELAEAYFGNKSLQSIYVGNNKIFPIQNLKVLNFQKLSFIKSATYKSDFVYVYADDSNADSNPKFDEIYVRNDNGSYTNIDNIDISYFYSKYPCYYSDPLNVNAQSNTYINNTSGDVNGYKCLWVGSYPNTGEIKIQSKWNNYILNKYKDFVDSNGKYKVYFCCYDTSPTSKTINNVEIPVYDIEIPSDPASLDASELFNWAVKRDWSVSYSIFDTPIENRSNFFMWVPKKIYDEIWSIVINACSTNNKNGNYIIYKYNTLINDDYDFYIQENFIQKSPSYNTHISTNVIFKNVFGLNYYPYSMPLYHNFKSLADLKQCNIAYDGLYATVPEDGKIQVYKFNVDTKKFDKVYNKIAPFINNSYDLSVIQNEVIPFWPNGTLNSSYRYLENLMTSTNIDGTIEVFKGSIDSKFMLLLDYVAPIKISFEFLNNEETFPISKDGVMPFVVYEPYNHKNYYTLRFNVDTKEHSITLYPNNATKILLYVKLNDDNFHKFKITIKNIQI